jgi:DNA invertase Pin-like site-specific DNA recombinase
MANHVAYIRVSTKKQQKSGLGLEAQKAIIEHYAKQEQSQIIKFYIETESGKEIENRPQLQEAINFCKTQKAVLVVAKLDRLSRDVEHIFTIKKQLGDYFKSCDLPSTDSLTLSIFAGLAQREREIISIRTKLALQQKKKQGVKLGNPQNLTQEARQKGAEANKTKAQATKSNKIALTIIESMRKEGSSYQAIADQLNQIGLSTARGKKYQRSTIKSIYDKFSVAIQ